MGLEADSMIELRLTVIALIAATADSSLRSE